MEYIVLDIETTGLSKTKHRITEIAAVKVKNNKIIEKFDTLVNPECHIPSFITKLTGIDDEMVKDQPNIQYILPYLRKFMQNTTIIAHNATFDYGFIQQNFNIHLQTSIKNPKICTKKLATRILPQLPSKRLSALCEYYQITNEQAHRAMADTMATEKVFTQFKNFLCDKQFTTIKEIEKFEKMSPGKARESILISPTKD